MVGNGDGYWFGLASLIVPAGGPHARLPGLAQDRTAKAHSAGIGFLLLIWNSLSLVNSNKVII